MPTRSQATSDSEQRAILTVTANSTTNGQGANWSASVLDNNPNFTGFGSSGAGWTINIAGTQVANANNRSYDFGSGNVSSPFFPRSLSGLVTGLTPGTTYTATGSFTGAGVVGNASVSFTFTTNSPAPTTGTVPNVLGQTSGDAQFLITNAGFSPSGSTTTTGATAANNGTVSSQSPAGGTTATLGSSVTYVTYNYVPPPATPSTPTGFGVTSTGTTSISTSWNPAAGASGYYLYINGSFLTSTASTSYTFSGLAQNTTYTLSVVAYATNGITTVTSGTASISASTLATTFSTPNVVGNLRDSAITTLTGAGFGTVNVTNTSSGATSVNNRRVISQSPTSGQTASQGDTAVINVYNYLLSTPNIIGLTESNANTTLTNAGFTLYSSSLTTAGATVGNNLTVGFQSPTGGSLANPADSVTFTVFNFLTQVPNVIGSSTADALTALSNLGFTNITTILDESTTTPENANTVKAQSPVNSATTYNPKNQAITITINSLGIAGRRMSDAGSIPISTARRFTGTEWLDLTVQKRFDGTNWVDVSN